jgi:hypothetical protein
MKAARQRAIRIHDAAGESANCISHIMQALSSCLSAFIKGIVQRKLTGVNFRWTVPLRKQFCTADITIMECYI